MSAFMCEEKFIGAIAAECAKRQIWANGSQSFAGIATVLWCENVRSVRCRYTSKSDADLGIDSAPDFVLRGERGYAVAWTPAELGNAVHCLEYQSCQCEDWDATDAAKILGYLKDAIIRELPGYDVASWGSLPKAAS